MKQEKKATYSFYVSVNGEKPIDMDDLTKEERQELYQKLRRQYIEKGLGGEIIPSWGNHFRIGGMAAEDQSSVAFFGKRL